MFASALENPRARKKALVWSGNRCISFRDIPACFHSHVCRPVCLSSVVMTSADIIRDYPYIEEEDIRQALHYAAQLTEEEVHPISSR